MLQLERAPNRAKQSQRINLLEGLGCNIVLFKQFLHCFNHTYLSPAMSTLLNKTSYHHLIFYSLEDACSKGTHPESCGILSATHCEYF